jgi:hypothetical protein
VGEKLNDLYSAIYSLCPRDLRKRLKQLGFHQGRPRAPTGKTVTVIGMAHRKWGLIYEGFTHTRTSSETLSEDLQDLSQWMDLPGSRGIKPVLLKNGYHPLPEMPAASSRIRQNADAFLTSYQVRTTGPSAISWEAAERYVGKRARVEGKIIRTHNSGKACYLNFHNNFTRYLSLVIFQEDLWKFPLKPESFYLNKTIVVRGKIEAYEGRPEIIIHSPKQIKILERQP